MPRSVNRLIEYAHAGEIEKARTMHHALSRLFSGAFCETNPGPIKYLISKKWNMSEELRLPLVPPITVHRQFLDTLYDQLKQNPLLQDDFPEREI
jgi:dihydrodipicolinate synthase/N-acetylneuraminate lyase